MEKAALAAAVALAIASGPAAAGPELIKFPGDYLKGTKYQDVDRADVKQYRELYTQPEVIEAVRKGKPIPSGAVITLVQWSVHQDDKGVPLKGSDGRFLKKAILNHTIMEKRSGWGTEYPAELRNGEWEYAVYGPGMNFNPKANYKACFTCHKPHEKQDFVISLAKLANTFPGAHAAARAPRGDVQIVSFAFMPAKIGAQAGKPISFLNGDDSPHQIAVANGPKTAVLVRGQRASVTLDKAGEYGYICSLHPTMKGTIEVK